MRCVARRFLKNAPAFAVTRGRDRLAPISPAQRLVFRETIYSPRLLSRVMEEDPPGAMQTLHSIAESAYHD